MPVLGLTPCGPASPGQIPVEGLTRRLAGRRAVGDRIVVTGGCFDVLHRGHVRCLLQAAEFGEVLVVAVNSDATVRKLKGPGRPVNTAADRAAVLAAIGCVDYVTLFDDDTPARLLDRLRPDVYVKGGDYRATELAERNVVERHGGRVVTVDYLPGYSTTALVARAGRVPGPAVSK